jgi:hypothetical protein
MLLPLARNSKSGPFGEMPHVEDKEIMKDSGSIPQAATDNSKSSTW